ncbi:hemolysin-type calcium-binding region [Nostoc commune NIES-4072]|uniref:Hemolysin-type calcium-binding region n=1 Tax=Nostoc commune NIES-4072 TaxID=2005467 RepID=A0A2R5FNB1_NOSCO|nr:DUF4347 domain-containing protein [Nostoc commune]BBD68749.1 hemolysin-type calcium-binding region [Nostoc commune HK-02]GBG20250.1 hemolysin-type calcium-binding region [Nostoc commune NIES-4072]
MATLHTPHFQLNSVIPASYIHSLVFIDTAVADYQSLINGVISHTEVFVIDSTKNGVDQITEILATRADQNINSIHIVCHGTPGNLQLGNAHLGLDTLEYHSQQLQQWQKIFSASTKSHNPWNLLIYSCNVAFGDVGAEFIAKLHQLTGANIAASRQLIGNAALGGNWELEVRTAQMEVTLAFAETTRQAYAGVLATFTVNDTGDTDDGDRNNGITTLREAINLANATAGDDTIAFGGIFTDTTPDTITLTSGQLTITDDVTILGTGTSNLTVSGGNNASTVFEISGLATGVSINGLAIASGGIKVNRNSILSLANTSVSGNKAGSGISNSGILSLANTSVFGNTQGGIYNLGSLSLTGSSVYGNTWESSSVSANNNNLGGGIYNDASNGNIGTVSLINSSVSGNTANFGGGIYSGGTLRLTNSTVSGNTALSDGGGIYNAGVDYDPGSAILINTTISGNTALNDGGGIYNGFAYVSDNRLTLINNTINNNTADSDGDGTGDGGGVFSYFNSSYHVKVNNTIIAGNLDNSTSGNIDPDVRGGLIDSGNNLIGNNTGSTAFTTSTLVGTSANPIDPKLGLLENNGGATLTQALLAGSPAIDAGKNSLTPARITTDQRGAGFRRIFNGVVDIGAYEVQTPTTNPPVVNTDTVVTNTNDSGAGSLRQAILNANATLGADTITFAGVFTDATPDIITLTSGKLTITDDITILGTGASNLTISGNNLSGVFEISGTGTDASIDGLKIANANDPLGSILLNTNTSLSLTGSTVSDNTGLVGGIFNKGTLTLTSSTVSGNSGSSLGGGIFNKGTLSLTNSTVSGNGTYVYSDTAYGGGIFNTGNLSITDSTISNNNAYANGNEHGIGPNPYPSYGGGIYNSGSVDITRSTVSGNGAADGGGISNSGTFSLTNSTVSDNSVYYTGGGILNSGTLTLTNDTITSNTAEGYVGEIGNGGGVVSNGGTVIVGNTIIAGNFFVEPDYPYDLSGYSRDVSGKFTDAGNNLIGDNTASTGFTTSTLVGTSANPIDPKLSALQNNGGTTLTNALIGNSLAINAGNNALIPPGITTDQRGPGFDRISENTVDIGALEFNGLNGTNGPDNLVGKNYGDIINGQAGNDTITGNQGNDILTGGGGNDKFVYNLGDGVDTITDFGGLGKGSNPSAAVISELDTLKFQGAGLTARNMLLTQNASNLEVTFEGVADDKIILQNFPLENLDNLWTLGNILFDGQTSISDSFDVFDANSTQTSIFNKNTVTFLNDLNNNVNGFENSGDVINGEGGDDRIDGLSGNDLLRGGEGNDTLLGGEGNDTLVGNLGNDNLIGGAGDDILLGGGGSDTLTGGSGNDQFIYQTLSDYNSTITDFDQSQDKLVFTDLFKSQGYSSSNPIGDGHLKFVQSGTSTLVEVLISYSPSYSSFNTFATLDNFTATNLVVGSNVIV